MQPTRKKIEPPVKVHFMHRRSNSGGGEVKLEKKEEEKRDEASEEKTNFAPPQRVDISNARSKTTKTPVREALDLAQKFAHEGKFYDAIGQLDKAMAIHPELSKNVRVYLNRGSYHFKSGDYENALKDFDKALEIDEQVASVHFNRANVLKILKREEEALKSYSRAAELDPKLADAHAHVAQSLLKLKKYRQALASASRALEVDPKHLSALDAQVKSLAKLGRTLEAIDSVKALIQVYQKLANVKDGSLTAVPTQYRRAFARIFDHAAERLPINDERGLEFARMACSLDESFESFSELGNQLSARGLHSEAASLFHKCSELDPTKVDSFLFEGVSLIQLGEFEKSLEPLRRAKKLSEERKEIRYYLGSAYLNLGRFAEAVQQLRRVVDVSNVDEVDEVGEKARFLLASAYVHAGEEKRALELLQIARRSKRGKDDPEVHYLAGFAASLLDLDDDARACYEDCLSLDPRHQEALEGLRKLEEKKKVTHRAPSPPPVPPPPLPSLAPPQPPSMPPPNKLEGQQKTPSSRKLSRLGVFSGAEAAKASKEETASTLDQSNPEKNSVVPSPSKVQDLVSLFTKPPTSPRQTESHVSNCTNFTKMTSSPKQVLATIVNSPKGLALDSSSPSTELRPSSESNNQSHQPDAAASTVAPPLFKHTSDVPRDINQATAQKARVPPPIPKQRPQISQKRPVSVPVTTQPSLKPTTTTVPATGTVPKTATPIPNSANAAKPSNISKLNLMSEIASFQAEKLATPALAVSSKPPDLMSSIAQFRRESLKKVDASTMNLQRPPPKQAGIDFLGTLLTAMKNRRVLIEDVDFEDNRRNERESDDMFEADWT